MILQNFPFNFIMINENKKSSAGRLFGWPDPGGVAMGRFRAVFARKVPKKCDNFYYFFLEFCDRVRNLLYYAIA